MTLSRTRWAAGSTFIQLGMRRSSAAHGAASDANTTAPRPAQHADRDLMRWSLQRQWAAPARRRRPPSSLEPEDQHRGAVLEAELEVAAGGDGDERLAVDLEGHR